MDIKLLRQECMVLSEHIKDCQAQLAEKEKRISEARRKATTIKARYEIGSIRHGDKLDGPDCIRFQLILVNKAELDEYKENWGYIDGNCDPVRTSVSYRFCQHSDHLSSFEGIVTGGGGYCFIAPPGAGSSLFGWEKTIPCTREEWDMIRKGNIPEKFRPDWYVQKDEG